MKSIFTLIFFFIAINGFSQDIQAATIDAKCTTGYNYSFTVTLWTDASLNVSRPTIQVDYNDGNIGTFSLTTTNIVGGVKVSKYIASHMYAGTGVYNPNFTETYRIQSIKNIPLSQTQDVYYYSTVYISGISPPNHSPLLQNTTFSLGVNGNQVFFNPSYFDADNDSLGFSLDNCTVNNYYIPSGSAVNNTSGVITFSKDSIGLYAFNLRITEYRKNLSGVYQIIGTSHLDFVMNITQNVGVHETSNSGTQVHVKVFPNPASNWIYLETENGDTQIDRVIITNFLGQRVQEELQINQNLIDISNLPNGVYLISISKRARTDYGKFIKVNSD